MQKYRIIALALGLLVAVGTWFILEANAQTKPDPAPAKGQVSEQYQRLLDEQADRAKRAEVMLKGQEVQFKRVDALIAKQEELLERQLKSFNRFEKILDTWEAQQQQYQKYLDTLPKK